MISKCLKKKKNFTHPNTTNCALKEEIKENVHIKILGLLKPTYFFLFQIKNVSDISVY